MLSLLLNQLSNLNVQYIEFPQCRTTEVVLCSEHQGSIPAIYWNTCRSATSSYTWPLEQGIIEGIPTQKKWCYSDLYRGLNKKTLKALTLPCWLHSTMDLQELILAPSSTQQFVQDLAWDCTNPVEWTTIFYILYYCDLRGRIKGTALTLNRLM